MDLRDYINSFPRQQRMAIRQALAELHGVSEVTVRAWANGTRKHPYHLSSIAITELSTSGRVGRCDLRPDIFGQSK